MSGVDLENLSKKELIALVNKAQEGHSDLDYFLENLNGISWEYNIAKDKFEYVSANAEKILGYKHSEWTNFDSWVAMIYEEDRVHTKEFCVNETLIGKNHSMEYRMIKKNGEIIWVFDMVTLVKDAENNAVSLYGMIIDINSKKTTQLSLEQEHIYLDSIINNISNPIMVIKKDFTVELMNNAMMDQTGACPNNSKVKCYEVTYNRDTPCDMSEHDCPLRKTLKSKKVETSIHKSADTAGNEVFVELTATPLFDKNSECIGVVKSSHDITQHVTLTEKLRAESRVLDYKAKHDALTELPNRDHFEETLKNALVECRGMKHGIGLLFLDIDDFKVINDSLGHKAGDEVLKQVAKRVSSKMRDSDVFSRLGGDEFTVIVRNIRDKEDVAKVAQKVMRAFDDSFIVEGQCLELSCSIGISVTSDECSLDKLLEHADKAMYRAKEAGKSKYMHYEV